jgi:hypothetical protein
LVRAGFADSDEGTPYCVASLDKANPGHLAAAPNRTVMAKGQMRSSKEIRKPKKDKAAAKTATVPGSAVKQLETNPFQKKAKK